MIRSRSLLFCVAILPAFLAGCKDSLMDRSLVFMTGTTIGLEVAISAQDPNSPVKLVIGYKRAEGVLNPVYHSEGVVAKTTTPSSGAATREINRYRPDAYSVIAKINGEANVSAAEKAQGKLSVAQWFATGRAADLLASAPGIAGAVTGSSEVADAAAKEAGFARKLTGLNRARAEIILGNVYEGLLALKDDPQAQQLVADLDRFANSQLPDASLRFTTNPNPGPNAPPYLLKTEPVSAGFKSLIAHKATLEASINALDEALDLDKFEMRRNSDPAIVPVTNARDDPQHKSLKSLRERQKEQLDRIINALSTSKVTVDAVAYYCHTITQ